jgi:hypothetical protein
MVHRQNVEKAIEKSAPEKRRILNHCLGYKPDAHACVQVGDRKIGIPAGDVNQMIQRAKAGLWPGWTGTMNGVNTDTQPESWRFPWLWFAIAAKVFLCHLDNGFMVAFHTDRCADRVEVCLKPNGSAPMQGIVMLGHAISSPHNPLNVNIPYLF